MVNSNHETAHRIFQERPDLLAPVFRILDVPLPQKAAVEVLTPDTTEIRPVERRVDTVLRLTPSDGSGVFLLAIEAQGKRDTDKPASWAYYLSFLTAKYGCPALLMVTCQDEKTADWALGPFHLGWGNWRALTVRPLVLGPENVPLMTDPEEIAQDLSLAAFSVMTHAHNPDVPAILKALASVLGDADEESRRYYLDLIEIGLGNTRARESWRKLMLVNGTFFPGRGTFGEQRFLEGRAEGQAHAVVRLLERRGIAVTSEVRERITACGDSDILDRWLDRAVEASTAEEIFADKD